MVLALTPRETARAPAQVDSAEPAASPNGIAVLPPAYGIEVADEAFSDAIVTAETSDPVALVPPGNVELPVSEVPQAPLPVLQPVDQPLMLGEIDADTPAEPGLPEATGPGVPVEAEGPPTEGTEIELLMPEPPEALSTEDQATLDQVQGRVRRTARTESRLPSAGENTQAARQAVEEPTAETLARAQNVLMVQLDNEVAPSPEIVELCENIRTIIANKRPPDEDSLLASDFEEIANEAGGELNQSIEGEVEQTEAGYAALDPRNQPQGTAQQHAQPIETPPRSVQAPEIDAGAAAPTPIPAENLSLQADAEASQTSIDAASMNTEVAQEIQTGPVAEARQGQAELEETAAEAEAAMIARLNEAIATAQANMAALQARALQTLNNSRRETIRDTSRQQTEMVASETLTREGLSRQAEAIFNLARDQVNTNLQGLQQAAMERWNSGKARLSREFEASLARVDRWKQERYEGIGGSILEVWDDWTGAPGWVTRELDRAEREFGDGVCQLLTQISIEVNTIIATCERIIGDARRDIDALFQQDMPAELRAWAEGEQTRFQERLNGLQDRVSETRDEINGNLSQEASQAVQAVREEIHQRREAAKGKLRRIAEAIGEFLEDPIRGIINGLLSLVGIPPASFWAVVNRIGEVISDIADDPLGFAENLLSAIGQGFEQFFDRFGEHLLAGFWDWLFSGLSSVGVEIPTEFSLKSIITFILQLLGISWERIRALLVKHIGEENVALIEKAWEIVSTLIEQGPQGIFEMIKEQLNPQEIIDQILEAAIDYLIETLIQQVIVRVAMLFNPVGAIAQAIEAIYKVLRWVFTNAARIFSLIETVVNGMAEIIAGNISGMANAVEEALARLIAPVIDFIAGLVGLDDLPDKIADTIRGFQEWIEGILDRVIGWLADRGRQLLQALGIGEAPEAADQAAEQADAAGRSPLEDTFDFLGETHSLRLGPTGDGTVRLLMASETYKVFPQILRRLQSRQVARLTEADREEDAHKLHAALQEMIDEAERAGAPGGPVDQARRRYRDRLDAVPMNQRRAWIQDNGTLNDAEMEAWDDYYYRFLAQLNELDERYDFSGGVRSQIAVGVDFVDRRRNILMRVSENNVRQHDLYGVRAHPANATSSSRDTFYSYTNYALTGTSGWGPIGPVPALLPYAPVSPSSSSLRHVIINDHTRTTGTPSKSSEDVPGIDSHRPHRGHLIGNALGGPGHYASGNIVPMTISANNSQMKTRLENPVRIALENDPYKNDPQKHMIFDVKAQPIDWNSARTVPQKIKVSYKKIHPNPEPEKKGEVINT